MEWWVSPFSEGWLNQQELWKFHGDLGTVTTVYIYIFPGYSNHSFYIYIYVYIYIYLYLCIYICIYIYIFFMSIYIHIYIYTYNPQKSRHNPFSQILGVQWVVLCNYNYTREMVDTTNLLSYQDVVRLARTSDNSTAKQDDTHISNWNGK